MSKLKNVVGGRGESIAELSLTNLTATSSNTPLFSVAFLGAKWPGTDFYVELTDVPNCRPFFLAQIKTTQSQLLATHLSISTKASDISQLHEIPAPTYLLGVHEPTKRVFAKAVLASTPAKAFSKISLKNELTVSNMQKMYNEVMAFWSGKGKPTASVFT